MVEDCIARYIAELKNMYPEKDEFNVMIAGTFDIVHNGHIFLINQAAKIGKVHVIVARDISVERFKHQAPILPEDQRLRIIRAVKNVEWAELGSSNEDWILRIAEVCPDIFLLGPNQYGDPDYYENALKARGCDTIFRRLTQLSTSFDLNSSSKIKRKIKEKWIDNGYALD